MDIKDILEELKVNKVIESSNVKYKPLLGGTTSRLYLIDSSLVIKLNDPETLRSESNFLESYRGVKMLPRLHYVDPSYQYIVYSFIPGTTDYERGNKAGMLFTLVRQLLNHYHSAPDFSGWGLVEENSRTWSEFLLEGVGEASTFLGPHLNKEDFNLVIRLIKERRSSNTQPFLLHGDCGIHNFISSEGKLVGVIDPTPVLGEPHYDLLYAFCSSPDDLTMETILPAIRDLKGYKNWSLKTLYSDILIVLFLRLATCIKHHPHDFDEYLTAWDYWKGLIMESDFNE